ncbi:MAG: LysR family transcriptional regulator [Myxococcota bacterium]
MSSPSFDWDDLRYFLAVLRTGRLALAGRALGVRHTTVGRRIAALEEGLGQRLFLRTADGLKPTAAGARIQRHAESIEAQVVGVLTAAPEPESGVGGRVRLALVDSWAGAWLAPELPELARRHPGLVLEVLTGAAPLSLTRGEADVAVRLPRPKQPDLSATYLAEPAVGLYGRPELVRRHAAALAADAPDGAGVPLGMYTPSFAFLQVGAWFRALARTADVRLVTTSTPTLVGAAAAGHCLAVIPRFIAAAVPGLVSVGGRDLSRHKTWAVVHRERRREPQLRAVVDFLKAIAPGLERGALPS